MMTRNMTLHDLWRLNLNILALAAEVQTVMALRTLGMFGLWNTGRDENRRMVAEKAEAFTRSAQAAAVIMARGGRPDQVVKAGMKPLRTKTRTNAARLIKAGPKSVQ
jgi:hypothetical protein